MTSLVSNIDALRIGTVDFVSPDEIKVLLDLEAPNDIALNTGTPRPFPRINSYTIIPNENGFLVAQIEWITIERSQYPKRRENQDYGMIDLPYPLRKMSLNPLGVLKEVSYEDSYEFSRGIENFPTVGDPVLLPTQNQLKSIIESGNNRRVVIGVSPLAGNAKVAVDPDRLFGRHLAILGNTGSGKSCSVAGTVRWSIEAAQRCNDKKVSARFIILDPNGEYATAFNDISGVRVYGVEENYKCGIKQLKVPIWLWNSAEWTAFTQASSKVQRPTLIQALRTVRDGSMDLSKSSSQMMRKYLRTLVTILSTEINNGNPWGNYPRSKNFFEKIKKLQSEFNESPDFSARENASLKQISNQIKIFINDRSNQYPNYDFTKTEVSNLLELIKSAHQIFGGSLDDALPIDADAPLPFKGKDFLGCIEANAELMGTTEYIEPMLMRIKTLLSNSKLKKVIAYEENYSLEQWMSEYIYPEDFNNSSITVIDLSLIPVELVHIITAVIARMTLEVLQRYRKTHGGETLPTTLIMEEAHTFIKRYNNDNNDSEKASENCAKVFEKIAREGRKFGLGLILSSQRPSELSPTVLSQCNSYLLHRICNDRDQELVNRLVPDNLRGLLKELPSLPSRDAILLGWASELPVMVRMNYLKESQRPKSDDPDYWNIWTKENKSVDWKVISNDWQELNLEEK